MELSSTFSVIGKQRNKNSRGMWLAQSKDHETLGLGVMSLNPTSGVDLTKKTSFKKKGDNSIKELPIIRIPSSGGFMGKFL